MKRALVLIGMVLTMTFNFAPATVAAVSPPIVHPNVIGDGGGGGCPYDPLTYIGTWGGWTWYCFHYVVIPGWRVTG